MSKKKKTSMIGHDPLAWINDKQATEEEQPQLRDANAVIEEAAPKDTADEHELATVTDILDGTSAENQDAMHVQLQGDLTIQHVHALYSQLIAVLEGSQGEITLDDSAVGKVDTAAVQLLCAFAKQAKQGERTLLWQQPIGRVAEVANSLGMAKYLSIPQQVEL